MKLLFRLALQNKKMYGLLAITAAAMILLSISSQLEMFSIRVLTNRNATDVFELFSDNEKEVTFSNVEEVWVDISGAEDVPITKNDADKYIINKKGSSNSFIDKVLAFLDSKLNLMGNLKNMAIMILLVGIMKALSQFASQYSMKLVAIKVSKSLREKYFAHLQTLSMSFYQQYHVGNLSSRVMGDASVVAESINSFLINYMQTPFVILTTFTVLLITSFKLTLIIFIGCPLIIFPIIFLARRIKRISKMIQRNQESFGSVLLDFLSGIQTVKAFAMEKFSYEKYCEQNDRMAELEEKISRYSFASRPVLHFIGSFFLSVVLLYGIFIANMSVSELIFYCALLYLFYEPIKKFSEENSKIQRGVAAAERMFEVLDMQPKVKDKEDALEFHGLADQIVFDDVWFKYGEEWILKGLSFTINKGETVALVGPTGAGKSTIAQLFPRLYDIQKGSIKIDGNSIDEYTQKSLRENMGYVPQKPFLFYDTIASNISFGRDFPEQEIKNAAERAHAAEFIENLPNKYNFPLAEGGKNLSGGQQQRLAIARALVKNASILIMDEATSSLDAVSENKIRDAIQDLHGHVTQIIIAHRFSTIENADKIVYMEKGEIIDIGDKKELLKRCEGFRIMWRMMHKDDG